MNRTCSDHLITGFVLYFEPHCNKYNIIKYNFYHPHFFSRECAPMTSTMQVWREPWASVLRFKVSGFLEKIWPSKDQNSWPKVQRLWRNQKHFINVTTTTRLPVNQLPETSVLVLLQAKNINKQS